MKFYAALALCPFGTGTAFAAERHEIGSMVVIDGVCSNLVIAGTDRTGDCPNAVFNTAYRDENSSFRLMARGGIVISFFGLDHEKQGNHARLDVEKILITPAPKARPGASETELLKIAVKATQSLPASGFCEYSDPQIPDAYVNCAATAAGKSYAFKFHPTGFKEIG